MNVRSGGGQRRGKGGPRRLTCAAPVAATRPRETETEIMQESGVRVVGAAGVVGAKATTLCQQRPLVLTVSGPQKGTRHINALLLDAGMSVMLTEGF